MSKNWQFWIDVGGTFTDCIGIAPDGTRHFAKVLSSGRIHATLQGCDRQDGSRGHTSVRNKESNSFLAPELATYPANFWQGYAIELDSVFGGNAAKILASHADGRVELGFGDKVLAANSLDMGKRISFSIDSELPAPILAIRRILQLPPASPLPRIDMRLGTTRGTNALLTRRGAKVAFVTTKGFGDLLRIGFQNRPDLFALNIQKPEELFACSLEINERIQFDGEVSCSLDEEQVIRQLEEAKANGIESLAICFMHAHRFSQHEQRVGQLARDMGFAEVSLSHEVASEIRIIPRAYTTVLDAYLNPILRRYIDEIKSHLHAQSQLNMFSSAGSLVPADSFTGKDSILSGPAGGVVGFARSAESAGIQKSIGFDMGGTSTDVSRFDGEYHYQYESEKSGIFIVSPTLAIETVAAGGGSICSFDGLRLQVGPASAGADPGPACYGKGGPLTISDINLYLGRIHPGSFPIPVDEQAVEQRLEEIQLELENSGLGRKTKEWLAKGFLKIAIAKTADAIRLVSLQKGYDCTEYGLVAFGGAAGQICCQVADELGITKILVHPQAGILSAVGIGLANEIIHRSLGMYCMLDSTLDLASAYEEMESEFDDWQPNQIEKQTNRPGIRRKIDLRYEKTDSYLTLDFKQLDALPDAFANLHHQRFGYTQDRALEIGCLRLEINFPSNVDRLQAQPARLFAEHAGEQKSSTSDGRELVDRGSLRPADSTRPADTVDGPAIICDPLSTVVVDEGWRASCLEDFQLLISRPVERIHARTEQADEIQLELLNKKLMSIAEQMGESLRATAVSVNVKERLDFSCAIFDAAGNLIANAPHIPIHLGAMSECVRYLIQDNEVISPGDVFVTNDPYRGGSHLPDITVVTPCFVTADNGSSELTFWVASRAHHAEIGGKVPGSMPPHSTRLGEEGVLIQNFKILTGTNDRFGELFDLLQSGEFPSRRPDLNIADIRAQIAANRVGAQALQELSQNYDRGTLGELIERIFQLAEMETQKVLRSLDRNLYEFADYLDCGARIRLQIRRTQDQLEFDFTGSSDTLPNNLNANLAIVQSAIIYCLRVLIGKDIPLNHGILRPVRLIVPECFLNPKSAEDPLQSPAIVGGNVETSQRIVDVILGALEIAAASQGTTNNVIFGDETFGYYETVCGGSGATATAAGADAVQVHITNTRITDPEILESKYPVVLDEFSIRAGSGGAGQHRGGNGVTRKLRFRKPLQLTVLANRYREYRPFGLQGGESGEKGELKISETEGLATELVLKTPGGGGWGRPSP